MNGQVLALVLALATDSASAASRSTAALAPVAPAPGVVRTLSAFSMSRVRVVTPARSYVVSPPRFGADGVGWARAEGFPRSRPALVVGADWDSVPPPPNPLPWESVERIERARSTIGPGTMLGVLAGGAVGGLYTRLALMESGLSAATGSTIVILGVTVGAVAAGWLGHLMLDPPERWEPVYVAERR